jgi:ankyrin repeat protein
MNLRERKPLMHAAQHGNPELIKLLLQRGAKLNSTDQKGFNAADYTRAGEKAENLNYLKSLGLEENKPGRGL